MLPPDDPPLDPPEPPDDLQFVGSPHLPPLQVQVHDLPFLVHDFVSFPEHSVGTYIPPPDDPPDDPPLLLFCFVIA